MVDYGDITMTFPQQLVSHRPDRGVALRVGCGRRGEVAHRLQQRQPRRRVELGETPRKPKIPLVATYPKEGTLYDSPLYTLKADWVSDAERKGAEVFIKVISWRANQQKRPSSTGSGPGNPDVAIAAPIIKANGVDPSQPTKLLQVPSPPVMISLLDKWKEQRKGARVLPCSTCPARCRNRQTPTMPEARPSSTWPSGRPSMRSTSSRATTRSGCRVFTNGLGPNQDEDYQDLLPVQPMSTNREKLPPSINPGIAHFRGGGKVRWR